jgi:hypothetical protein
MQFDEKERLQIHKEVHQHKQKNDGWTRHWYANESLEVIF